MRQFVPFEDEWEMLDAFPLDVLVPYQSGVRLARQRDGCGTAAGTQDVAMVGRLAATPGACRLDAFLDAVVSPPSQRQGKAL